MNKTKIGAIEEYIKHSTDFEAKDSSGINILLHAAARFVADEHTYESYVTSYSRHIPVGGYDLPYAMIVKMISFCIFLKENE